MDAFQIFFVACLGLGLLCLALTVVCLALSVILMPINWLLEVIDSALTKLHAWSVEKFGDGKP